MNTETQHLIRIITVPSKANVAINGRFLGTTTSAGLMVLWKQGDMLRMEKNGFEPVTLRFSSPTPKRAITVTLKPLARSAEPTAQIQGQGAAAGQVAPSQHYSHASQAAQTIERPRSWLSLRRLSLLVFAPFFAGIVAGSVLYYTSPQTPWQSMPPSLTPPSPITPPIPAPTPRPALPPPINPPRATNLVLANNQKMDKIISTVEYLLKFTNDERMQRGLPPLQSSAALAFIAQNHAENMCDCRRVEHDSTAFPAGWTTFGERLRLVGLDSGSENLAQERWQDGTMNSQSKRRNITQDQLDQLQAESTAKWLVAKWMLSDTARARMLDPAWLHLGIGICPCSGNVVYATQVFSAGPGAIR